MFTNWTHNLHLDQEPEHDQNFKKPLFLPSSYWKATYIIGDHI